MVDPHITPLYRVAIRAPTDHDRGVPRRGASRTRRGTPRGRQWANGAGVFENQPSVQFSIVGNGKFTVVTSRSSKGRIEAPARESAFYKYTGALQHAGVTLLGGLSCSKNWFRY